MTILGLFLNEALRTGGHKRYLALLNGLASKGHCVILLINPACSVSIDSRITIIRTPVSGKEKFDSFSKVFKRAAIFASKELIVSVNAMDLVLVFGETHFSAAKVLADKMKAPLVFGFRSNSFRAASSPLAALKSLLGEFRVARRASRIVFQSEYDRKDFLRRFPFVEPRTGVVGNAYIEPWFSRTLAGAHHFSDRNKLLFIGNCSPRKGLSVLVAAMVLLRERGINGFSLDVAGACDGTASEIIKASIHKAGLGDSIRFLGPRKDVLELMASSGLLIVPSIYDSYPNVILEALYIGLPVIATRTGGVPEMLGPEGLLIPPGNPYALADALGSVLSNPTKYEKLRYDCRDRRALFDFDWIGRWDVELQKVRKNV